MLSSLPGGVQILRVSFAGAGLIYGSWHLASLKVGQPPFQESYSSLVWLESIDHAILSVMASALAHTEEGFLPCRAKQQKLKPKQRRKAARMLTTDNTGAAESDLLDCSEPPYQSLRIALLGAASLRWVLPCYG